MAPTPCCEPQKNRERESDRKKDGEKLVQCIGLGVQGDMWTGGTLIPADGGIVP